MVRARVASGRPDRPRRRRLVRPAAGGAARAARGAPARRRVEPAGTGAGAFPPAAAALAALDEALERALDDVAVALRAGRLDAALASLRDLDEAPAATRIFQAYLERQRGDYEASLATLDALLRDEPRSGEALLQRAFVRWTAGDLAGAAADFDAIERDETQAPELQERARTEAASLAAHRSDLAPVGRAADAVAAAWWGSVGLVALVVLGVLWSTLRR